MSDTERSKLIEDNLPSIQAIIDEYARQGRTLSDEEAENIREQMRKDIETGSSAADGTSIDDDAAGNVSGGAGGSPQPTGSGNPPLKGTLLTYDVR